MSDEPKGAADDAETTANRGGQTVVVSRPLRPTGKRSRQVATEVEEPTGETKAAVTKNGEGRKAKAAKAGSGPSRNPIAFVWTYLKQVVAEMRKVIWPNRKQMISYTSVVLVFLVFMVALIGVVDLGLARLVLMVFG